MSTKKVPAKKAAKEAAAKKVPKKAIVRTALKKTSAKKVATKALAKKAVVKMAKKGVKKVAAKKSALKPMARLMRLTLAHPVVQAILSKATDILNDRKLLNGLVTSGLAKLKTLDVTAFHENLSYLKAMLRLLRAYYRSDYREVPWKSLVAITGAVAYVVSPVDLIPDWIPVAGLLDDAAVVAFVLKRVKGDLDAYIEWEATR